MNKPTISGNLISDKTLASILKAPALDAEMITANLLRQLARLNIPVANFSPWEECEDALLELGGEFQRYSISIGNGYYQLTFACQDNETFISLDGAGDLADEFGHLGNIIEQTPGAGAAVWRECFKPY